MTKLQRMKLLRRSLHKIQCERSLLEFTKKAWSLVEAGNPFQSNWHIDMIIAHLEAVSRYEIPRLLITMPPRHMKSLLCSVFYQAWVWTHSPDTQFLNVSYSARLSNRDSVKVARILNSRWFQSNWPIKLTKCNSSAIQNIQLGHRQSSGIGGTVTGEGGDQIFIDDGLSLGDMESTVKREGLNDWYGGVLASRVNNPKRGAIVIVQQRGHQNDLAGYVLSNENFEHLCLPARYEGVSKLSTSLNMTDPRTEMGQPLWEGRYGDKELKKLESTLGVYNTASQLQQTPTVREGGLFSQDSFITVDSPPTAPTMTIRFWDPASTVKMTADYTASCKISYEFPYFYIEDVTQFRKTPYDIHQSMRAIADADKQKQDVRGAQPVRTFIEQEPSAGARHNMQRLIGEVFVNHIARPYVTNKSKTFYLDIASAKCQAGLVRMVRAPWNKNFMGESMNFPRGKHDDMVDSFGKAMYQLLDHVAQEIYRREKAPR